MGEWTVTRCEISSSGFNNSVVINMDNDVINHEADSSLLSVEVRRALYKWIMKGATQEETPANVVKDVKS